MSHVKAKRVSNYELFYDLVFVFITTNLTRFIHGGHVTVFSLFVFVTANFLFLSLWTLETVYLNQYGERDLLDIFTIIASMFAIGSAGLHMELDFEKHGLAFNSWITVAYAIIWLQYYLRGKKITERPKEYRLMQNILLCLIASGLFMVILSYFKVFGSNVFGASLYLVLVFFPLLFRNNFDYSLINFPHLVERYQLITIITFGETVIATITTYTNSLSLVGMLIFLGMSFLFMFYVSQTQLNIDHHQVTPINLYSYAHLGIILGLNFFTVGIESIGDEHHRELGFIFFLVGFALFYLCLSLTSHYNQKAYRPGKKDFLLYVTILVCGLGAIYVTRYYLYLSLICFNIMAFILVNHVFYFRRRKDNRN